MYLRFPFFLKKGSHLNVSNDFYTSEVFLYKGKSYTYGFQNYLGPDRVLIVDDFLANGEAVLGLKE